MNAEPTASPRLVAAAASPRSEFQARFDLAKRFALEARDAAARHLAAVRERPDAPHDSLDYFEWQVRCQRACSASVDAQIAYHKACDALFLREAGQ